MYRVVTIPRLFLSIIFSIFVFSAGCGGTTDTKREAELFQLGLDLYGLANYSEAITQFKSQLDEFPKGSLADDAHFYVGKSLYWLDDIANAHTEFHIVLNDFSNSNESAGAQYWTGKCHHVLKEYTEARKEYQVVVDKYASSGYIDDALYQIGNTYYDEDDFDPAIAQFNIVLRDYGTSDSADDAQYFLGRSYHKKTPPDYNQARIEYRLLITDFSSSNWADDAQYNIGKTYYDAKDYNSSVTELQKVLTDYPGSNSADGAQYFLARSYHQLGDYPQARTEYGVLITGYLDSTWVDDSAYQTAKTYYDYAGDATNDNDALSRYETGITQLELFRDNTTYALSSRIVSAHYFVARSIHKISDLISTSPDVSADDTNQCITESDCFDKALDAYDKLINDFSTDSWADNAQYQRGIMYYDKANLLPADQPVDIQTELALALVEFNLVTSKYETSNSSDNAQYYIGRSYHIISNIDTTDRISSFASITFADAHSAYDAVATFDSNSIKLDDVAYQKGVAYWEEGDLLLGGSTPDYNTIAILYNSALDSFASVTSFPGSVKIDNALLGIAFVYHSTALCSEELAAFEYLNDTTPNTFIDTEMKIHVVDTGVSPLALIGQDNHGLCPSDIFSNLPTVKLFDQLTLQ